MKRSQPKRGKPLERRTPLQPSSIEIAKKWLARSKALGRKPMKRVRRDTGPDRETRELVLARDGYACVACGQPAGEYRGVDGRLDIHHRRARAMGGSKRPDTNQPQNLITLHRRCHEWVERNRHASVRQGWLVQQGADPAAIPVRVFPSGSWLLLAADGSFEVVSGPEGEETR